MSATPILLLVRTLGAGGTERQTAELAKSLDPSQFKVHVGCVFQEGWRAEELRDHGIPIVELPIRTLIGRDPIVATRVLGAYARQHGIRLLHAFDPPMNVFGVPAGRVLRLPVVLGSQRTFRDVLESRQQKLLRISDRLAHGIVANCEAVRQYLIQDFGMDPARIDVCHNGIDLTSFSCAERFDGAEAGGDHDGSKSALTASACIGVVCVLRPEKSIETLIDAFAKVRDLGPGLQLKIVGSGSELEALQRRAAPLGSQCEFVPAVRDVTSVLSSIDIFVLPTRSEALSNSIMEAMACGCATVASRVGGNPELIEHGATGLLFEAGNVDDLAVQLRTLILDRALRRRVAEAGAQRIHTEFSNAASAKRMSAIYERYLAARGN